MNPSVLVAIIAGFSSIVVAIITVVVKDWLDRQRLKITKEREETITHSDIGEMVVIQEWLNDFREKFDFQRASIYQFHNGGKFFQGRSMKKFSMTYESVAPGYEKIKRQHQNILASEYPKWITTMLSSQCFSVESATMECVGREELEAMGVQQLVTVPLHCLKGNLIGFIVGYNISGVNEDIKVYFEDLVEEGKFVSGYLL